MQNVGGRAKYEWKLSAERLLVSANIDFVPSPPRAKAGDVSGRIASGRLTEIRDIWEARFMAVNKKNASSKKISIDFEARRNTGDFTVNVHKGNSRSNASNWYIGDTRRG